MSNIAHFWNPRTNNPHLKKYWINFGDKIIVTGNSPEQSGILRIYREGGSILKAELKISGRTYEETVTPGHDITLWINGLDLVINVRAVVSTKMLIAFGVTPGSVVNITVDESPEFGPQGPTAA